MFFLSFLPSFLALPCSLWNLSSWPGIEPGPLAVSAESLTSEPPEIPADYSYSLFVDIFNIALLSLQILFE